jgi:ferritin-like metal-binding protein YciE
MSKPTIDLMNQKFILQLNAALAMENAGVERLQTRIGEVSLPDAKQRLEHHLQESLQHQKILQQLVSNIGGQPTQENLGLPLPSYPTAMKEMIDKTMTKPEYELKRAEEDMIVENAEVCVYLMLIQQCQMAGGVYSNAIAPLSKNMNDEQEQADWLKTTSPAMLAQLWPKILSSIVGEVIHETVSDVSSKITEGAKVMRSNITKGAKDLGETIDKELQDLAK